MTRKLGIGARGLLLFGVALALAVLTQGGAGPAAAQPPPEPHYACWMFGGALDGPVVSLETQFGVEDPVDVQYGWWLCNPAIKTRAGQPPEGTLDAPHLRGFDIVAPPLPDPAPVVNLSDQFGSWGNVVVGSPAWLLAPALKTIGPLPPEDPPPDPHYKCYDLPDLGPGSEWVTVEDQFSPAGIQWYVSINPAVLCLPAGKNGAPIPDAPHLLCHYAENSLLAPMVNVRTQFGDELVLLHGPGLMGYLCVPGEKVLPGVGGVGELPLRDADAAAEAASAPSGGSGLSTGGWAGIVTGAAALVVVLAGGGMYAVRRRIR